MPTQRQLRELSMREALSKTTGLGNIRQRDQRWCVPQQVRRAGMRFQGLDQVL